MEKFLKEILKEQKEFRKSLKDLDSKVDQRFTEQDEKFEIRLKNEIEKQGREFRGELKKQGKEFQLHISVLVEDFDAKIKVLCEQYEEIRNTLDAHTDMMGEMKEDIEIIKSELQVMRRELTGKAELRDVILLERRVEALEEKMGIGQELRIKN